MYNLYHKCIFYYNKRDNMNTEASEKKDFIREIIDEDLKTGKYINTLTGYSGIVWSVAIS